jgi:hypothetical protein
LNGPVAWPGLPPAARLPAAGTPARPKNCKCHIFGIRCPGSHRAFGAPAPGMITNLSSGGDSMKKLLAAIFAGMFALTTASVVVAAEKKEDTKKDSKKKDEKKKAEKK